MEPYGLKQHFNPFWFITEVGFALMRAKVESVLIDEENDDERDVEYYWHARKLVENVAYCNGLGELNWNPDAFLSVYKEFRQIYRESYDYGLRDRDPDDDAIDNNDVDLSGKVTVFCPRGCNQVEVNAISPWDECASCGSIMRERCEDSYYDSLERCGQVM